MARRTKDEAEQTRNAILDAAEQVFYRHGVARTSLQQLAQAAGVTRGAVYWYFRDKVEILDAMAQRVFLPQEEILEQLAARDSDTPLADLSRACIDSLRRIGKDKRRQTIITILNQRCEYTDDMAPIMQRRHACKDRMLDRITRLFSRAQKLNQLAAGWTPRVAAMTLQSLMSGLILGGLEREDNAVFGKAGTDCLRAFFGAVAEPSP